MKKSWKYKRLVNQSFYRLREHPKLLRILVTLMAWLRHIVSLGKQRKADLATGNYYSLERNYIYISTPKAATSSIIEYLNTEEKSQLRKSSDNIQELLEQLPRDNAFYRFCFVRNPWARVYSCWQDKISNQKKFCDIFIITRYKGLYPDMPFHDFVKWLCTSEGSDKYADRHWISQYELIAGYDGNLHLDFIGKIESFATDFISILTRIGFDRLTVPEKNRLNQYEYSYREHYDDTSKKLIEQRYKKDIEAFGYSF